MIAELAPLIREEFSRPLPFPVPVAVLRLAGAALLCALIGYERERGDHAAGLRTHMLIGVGASAFALIVIAIVELFGHRPDTIRMDPIRMVEAATAGVAFLAAGMIVLSRGEVKNLTTGAGMWLAAAIGVSAGLGLWTIALACALIGFGIQLLGRLTHDEPPAQPEAGSGAEIGAHDDAAR